MTSSPGSNHSLVFGVVDAPPGTPSPLAEKLRDLTVSWCRYGYRGPILVAPSVAALLGQAAQRGFRHCFVQFAGNLIRERWAAEGHAPDMPALLGAFAAQQDYLVAGYRPAGDAAQLARRSLLVDVGRLATLGSPAQDIDALPAASRHAGLPVRDLEAALAGRTLDLGATDPAQAIALLPCLGAGIEALRAADGQLGDAPNLSADQREFLGVIARQTANARRGVFLWNIEPYDDIAGSASGLARAGTVYAVAAGFKPNAILHAHGFDADSAVVFFDYSERALAIRRYMVENWDGSDFPGLVRHLVRTFPTPQTYYHLPGDSSPDGIAWHIVEQAWQNELRWWGGADGFAAHWQAYRRLPHRYVLCNLLDDPGPVLREMQARPRPGDIVWWSNAFFTMYGNWFHLPGERQAVYERWMAGLAAANPDVLLYGSDYANANANGMTAGEYWTRYRELAPSTLEPAALHRTEIRM